MADDQVTLTFNNDVFTIRANSDAGQQANYGGSVSVDYTTGTYSGLHFKVQGFGENSGFGDSGGNYGGTLGVNGNDYAVTGGGFTLSWTSMTPSTARAVLVANNNDTYDTQANPSSDGQSQAVSSTVNSSSNEEAVCFAQGTRIATVRGEVAVEALAIGDTVVTASGEHRAIRWIGTRSYADRFARKNTALLPIRFQAGSLADGVPTRDLRVSPRHAMFLDGVLIPAEHLVNGVTITQDAVATDLTYWHIELDSHDVLVAEGAASESFVDDHGRLIFHNADSFYALYPDARTTEAVYCARRVESGHRLAAVRRRLDARAGCAPAATPAFGTLLGHLDECDGLRIRGWAQDDLHPDAPVCLDVVVDGAVVALTYADAYRPDLEAAGIGDGCHGFALDLPLEPGRAHVVAVRRSADGAALAGSPWQVHAAAAARAA